MFILLVDSYIAIETKEFLVYCCTSIIFMFVNCSSTVGYSVKRTPEVQQLCQFDTLPNYCIKLHQNAQLASKFYQVC